MRKHSGSRNPYRFGPFEWTAISLALQKGGVTSSVLAKKLRCSYDDAHDTLCALKERGVLDARGAFTGRHESFSGGMTNYQILFFLGKERYLLRVPGAGTRSLINRMQEYEAYRAVAGCGITDDVVFCEPHTGYKIKRFVRDARPCNPQNVRDTKRCMELLRRLHSLDLSVSAQFDVFEKLAAYEKLCRSTVLPFDGWKETRNRVLSLRPLLKKLPHRRTLCHIDPVQDNFLFCRGGTLCLIDWEYAAMSDGDIDIAMFCIYAGYDLAQIDRTIDLYYECKCPAENRAKITCYVAACALLWTYWCEYKKKKGVSFDEYERAQYAYARDFSSIALSRFFSLGLSEG